MELLIVRHAIAEPRDPDADAEADAARRLTREGKSRFRRVAKGLRRLVPRLEGIATSPLPRAVQTGELLAQAYDDVDLVETPALRPGQPPEALARWLTPRSVEGTVAVVGHEPDLGLLASWLVTGTARRMLELKKGAACLLACPDGLKPGTATLLWSLRPSHLRGLRA